MATKFAEGVYFNMPREGAPEYVIGSIVIDKEKFADLFNNHSGKKIYMSVLMGKEKQRPYVKIDDFVPKNDKQNSQSELEASPIDLSDLKGDDGLPF